MHDMKGWRAVCGAVLLLGSIHAAWAQQKPAATPARCDATGNQTHVAAVNSDRILRESAPALASQKKLEREFSGRDKDLQDMAAQIKKMSDNLDKSGPSMAPMDRSAAQQKLAQTDADFQRKQREFRDDLNQRRNEELASVLDRANKVIKQIAESQCYDLIVQEAVYVSPRIDITDQVLKALASQPNN